MWCQELTWRFTPDHRQKQTTNTVEKMLLRNRVVGRLKKRAEWQTEKVRAQPHNTAIQHNCTPCMLSAGEDAHDHVSTPGRSHRDRSFCILTHPTNSGRVLEQSPMKTQVLAQTIALLFTVFFVALSLCPRCGTASHGWYLLLSLGEAWYVVVCISHRRYASVIRDTKTRRLHPASGQVNVKHAVPAKRRAFSQRSVHSSLVLTRREPSCSNNLQPHASNTLANCINLWESIQCREKETSETKHQKEGEQEHA